MKKFIYQEKKKKKKVDIFKEQQYAHQFKA